MNEPAAAGQPMARCCGHDERVVVEVPGRLSLGGYFVCLRCDLIPAEGHPEREPGWARRQYHERLAGGETT